MKPYRFGRYILLEKIGQGGMAEVFRAVARGAQGFQRILVVKRILPEMSNDPKFVQMFIDEAKISAMISHPNVVQVYEFGKILDSYFLTMEYVHGRNLGAVMGKLAELGRMPPPDVIAEVARQACLGLHHAHTMTGAEGTPLSIIHRDVTPANIVLGFNGSVKMLDFGIARAAEEVKETRTQAGAVKGKVAYLAPEQINRQAVDHRSDIFALGIVLHECLAGQRLFKADNPLAAMKAILDMPIPPPSALNPEVPKKLDRVVLRALQRNQDLRYPNAKAMAMDLEAVLVEQRYFSQRLPAFLKEIFKDDVTDGKDRLMTSDLADLEPTPEPEVIDLASSGVEEIHIRETRGAVPVADPVPAAAPEPTEVPIAAMPRLLHWLQQGRRKLWVGGGVLGLVAVVVAVTALSGGKRSDGNERETLAAGGADRTGEVRPLHPKTVSVSVDSFPQGAAITSAADGRSLGKTPATVTLPYGEARIDLRLELDGHEDETIGVIPNLDKPVFAKLRSKTPEPLPEPVREPIENPPVVEKPAHAAPDGVGAAPTTGSGKIGRPPRRRVKKAVPLDPFAN